MTSSVPVSLSHLVQLPRPRVCCAVPSTGESHVPLSSPSRSAGLMTVHAEKMLQEARQCEDEDEDKGKKIKLHTISSLMT
ncbi:hypothetical protein E2C01_058815 [Portunus trituberculatus]|uniref:Uncharacterized protein n=1 Tax=Portunus trituberculatus TaxID=210409 RepID=A0A5B7H574_PORTR|nr:hypothetical protein [Portunus trituberculatus]